MAKTSLLVAVRDQKSCPQGIRFVGSFFHNSEELEIVLLFIQQNASGPTPEEVTMWDSDIDETEVTYSNKTNQCVNLCENFLKRKGIASDQIEIKVKNKAGSTSGDILKEGQTGYYDAVVLGKRSTSFIEDMIAGSVSQEILAAGIKFPIWFCPELEGDRKNVLLCLDGSEPSRRAADHAGYILRKQPEHSITLFHIDRGQGLSTEDLFQEATEILVKNGVAKERIITKTVRALRVVNAMLEEIEDGKYGAVAMGWTGRTERKTGLAKLFAGEKSKSVLESIKNAAVWIVP